VVARFAREARAAARLKSEHVVRIFDVDEDDDGTPFFVMEHLSGRDLEQICEEEGPLEPGRAVEYVLQACEAVAEAHALGMVHRDLKPANLFVVRRRGSDVVKLLDFGITKAAADGGDEVSITSPASIIGSPLYMSPEQLKSSKDVDARADIWALGVVLYQLLTKKTPFEGATASELAAKIASDAPTPLRDRRAGIDPLLATAVERCLAKDPAERFPDVVALAGALAPFARAAETDKSLAETVPAEEPASPSDGSSARRVTAALSDSTPSRTPLAKTTGPSARSVPPPPAAEGVQVDRSPRRAMPGRRAVLGAGVGAVVLATITAWWRSTPPAAPRAPGEQTTTSARSVASSTVTLAPSASLAIVNDDPPPRAPAPSAPASPSVSARFAPPPSAIVRSKPSDPSRSSASTAAASSAPSARPTSSSPHDRLKIDIKE
jgi:serine/threonine-protein kinase